MFGGFAAFAVLGMVMIDKWCQRSMGVEAWQRLCPPVNLRYAGGPLRWLAAAVLLAGLIALHLVVIGLPAIW